MWKCWVWKVLIWGILVWNEFHIYKAWTSRGGLLVEESLHKHKSFSDMNSGKIMSLDFSFYIWRTQDEDCQSQTCSRQQDHVHCNVQARVWRLGRAEAGDDISTPLQKAPTSVFALIAESSQISSSFLVDISVRIFYVLVNSCSSLSYWFLPVSHLSCVKIIDTPTLSHFNAHMGKVLEYLQRNRLWHLHFPTTPLENLRKKKQ